MKIVQKTQSLCPVCFRTLDAYYVKKDNDIYFEKTCPQHGFFSVPAWKHMPHTPTWEDWLQRGNSSFNTKKNLNFIPINGQGCPQNCGLCTEHQQQSCCVLLEITQACTMQCPICYASAHQDLEIQQDISLEHIEARLLALKKYAGQVNIQLSGGEPTLRDDLPQIIQKVRDSGFNFVQINSNGLRLGQKSTGANYAKELKKCGLNLVYLQWDAAGPTSDTVYTTLRGGAYARIKERALQHCIEAQLPVLLVATLVRGINETYLGAIVTKALQSGPIVRGVHVQPVASFGRYPWQQNEAPRLTIPEILHMFEIQSHGMLKAEQFHPPQSEHALCSFSAVYTRNEKHELKAIHEVQGGCCSQASSTIEHKDLQSSKLSPAKVACDFVARHWSATPQTSSAKHATNAPDDFDRFLEKTSLEQRFTISGMAFQDAYSVDLARLRRCHIHILHDLRNTYPDLKPFCAFNLTSSTGFALHRGK